MPDNALLISTGTLTRQSLEGRVALVTGAGGGIGLEAARALAWMGARVIIAEINSKTGKAAAERINAEFGSGVCLFVQTDVGDERSLGNLARQAQRTFGKVDIVINNATLAPLGAVLERPITDWDSSYRVNLRGPVLLAQAFLPGMLNRNDGVFMCVSSVGGAYMGAYESLKTAQVELARTLDAELEGKNIYVFTISPGIVPTETASAGVAQIASKYGKTPQEFFEMYREQWISVEAAGAGFAAAAALAPQFRGLETYSKSGLIAAGIDIPEPQSDKPTQVFNSEQAQRALALCREVTNTLTKEYQGWLKRPLFERQWMLRDFKQSAGIPADQLLEGLQKLESSLEQQNWNAVRGYASLPAKVAQYFRHYLALAQGNIKDPTQLKEYTGIMQGWIETADQLAQILL